MELFVPAPLRPFVVDQGYARYDEADQATWRFVLLHLYEHLKAHAHESYTRGLFETGLEVDRIPRIEAIDRALQAFGWRAVCVSGFIPPRAFQSFQAAGILPIAAEIRDPQHVAYTPAPDIIHEAAGHAPILINEAYAAYVKRVGEVGKLAFSCPEDVEVYRAIAHLSALKEQPGATAPQLAAASGRLRTALAGQTMTSEATRLARLYWWTAEYGLMGTPEDYRLYGAGLLSSLGEAVFCRQPSVAKVPLSIACLEVDYDITQPQPQLFVAEDFGHLLDVLAQAEAQLAVRQSVAAAARAAVRSRLPAVVGFEGGETRTGTITEVLADDSGRVAMLHFADGTVIPVGPWVEEGTSAVSRGPGIGVPHGIIPWVEGGTSAVSRGPGIGVPHRIFPGVAHGTLAVSRPCVLTSCSGTTVSGTVERVDPAVIELRDARVCSGDRVLTRAVLVVPRGGLSSVCPADDLAAPEPDSVGRAPTIAARPPSEQRLRALYEHAYAAWRDRAGTEVVGILESIHQRLTAFPDDWLLRWNLLESLIKLGSDDCEALVAELRALEVRFAHQQPIATGLRSLRRLGFQSEAAHS